MKRDETLTAGKLLASYKNILRELYAMCCAITGDEALAGNALMDAMISVGAKAGSSVITNAARRACLKYNCRPEGGSSWLEDVPRAPSVSNESAEARRLAMLVAGCELSFKQAAEVMGVNRAKARAALTSVCACVPGKSDSQRLKNLKKLCAAELKGFPYFPDTAAFKRALENRLSKENEKNEMSGGGRRLISGAVALIMLLLIGFMLWTGAILLNYFRDSANQNSEGVNVSVQGID